jgi:hypothetical protein
MAKNAFVPTITAMLEAVKSFGIDCTIYPNLHHGKSGSAAVTIQLTEAHMWEVTVDGEYLDRGPTSGDTPAQAERVAGKLLEWLEA